MQPINGTRLVFVALSSRRPCCMSPFNVMAKFLRTSVVISALTDAMYSLFFWLISMADATGDDEPLVDST